MRFDLRTSMIPVALVWNLGACGPGSTADGPRCGDWAIDEGEMCDRGNLGGATCQSQGFGGGFLNCDRSCRFDTFQCFNCGDGLLEPNERCDGLDLAGQTCQTQGFSGGTLACDPVTCRYDVSGCSNSETLQNDNGSCTEEFGCNSTDGTGTSGNPQSLVECFNTATLQPPFWLTGMTYSIGLGDPPPDALNLEVYEWSGAGAPVNRTTLLPLGFGDLTGGLHTVTPNGGVQINTQNFCVGLNGIDPNDGFRLLFSNTSTVFGTSWIDATTCGTVGMTLVSDAVEPGNWCMTATISQSPP